MESETGEKPKRRPRPRGGTMAESWAHPVAVAVWMALHGLARPATTREIAHALRWMTGTVEPILARLRHAQFVRWDTEEQGWVVKNDLHRSFGAYRIALR